MRLQKATSFALYAVLELAADPSRQLSGTDIAQKYGISVHHLAKVLRDLGRAGIVDSARGVGGGYRFIGNAKRLTLLDVIQIFEPITPDKQANHEPALATAAGRALRVVLTEMNDHAIATFRSITISTMLKLMARTSSETSAPPLQSSDRIVAGR